MHLDLMTVVNLVLQVGTVVGVVPAVRKWLQAGRRQRVGSLVSQLAQEALIAYMRRKNVPAAEAATHPEAVDVLHDKLVAAGIDPSKARKAARDALAGAAVPPGH